MEAEMAPHAYLTDEVAMAAIVLWSSGYFDTASIAGVLHVREDAVYRTLTLAREQKRQTDRQAAVTVGGGRAMSSACRHARR